LTADITFSGTTTSPVVMFLRKERVIGRNYDILIHQSPKYLNPSASKLKRKEEQFLGYEFSSNRSKAGIKIIENSTLQKLTDITKSFIINAQIAIPNEYKLYSKLVKFNDILLNKTENYCGDIYPKRIICEGKPLSDYCKINEWKESDFAQTGIPSQYLEIGNLSNQIASKNLKTKRYCKKGDILVSSLTPRKSQIVIAKDKFMLSPAIYVLSKFENEKIRDKVFEVLQKDETINQMNALLDGFKITYAKISEQNLYNNIFL
jgi:type I restriction enzyme M protein